MLTEHSYGGIVKFQRMQQEFPNTPSRFNIIYMVSSHMPYGGEYLANASKRKGVAVVWNQNGVAYPGWHPHGWKQINAPMKKVHASANYVFYQSEFCKQSAEQFLGVRQGPSEVLYNSVDTNAFVVADSDPAPGELILLLGGTQYQFYRVECALLVLADLVREGINAKLYVTGRLCWVQDESMAARQVYALLSHLGLQGRVIFTGPYTQAEAPDLMRRAHILLHTKVNDPCPGLVVEAMACGLPVVYSKSGGVTELVGEEAGIGIPSETGWERDVPPDHEVMALATIQVAQNRARYAQAARRRAVERFDLEPWLVRHREIFAAVLQ
jgi:glycosyltransferase involved in cell wall biosynthesis